MLRRKFASFLSACALLLTAGGLAPAFAEQQYLDPRVAFQPSAKALDDRTVEVRYQIAKGYYLYHDKFKFSAAGSSFGPPQISAGKLKKDDLFGEVEVHFKAAVIRLPVERGADPGPQTLRLDTVSQGCADGGICYPPLTQQVEVQLPAVGSVPPAPPLAAAGGLGAGGSGDESADIAGLLRDASFWLVLASFFGFGLLLSFTPCVLPMVPILSGIIVGHGGKGGGHVSRGRAFGLSLAYVLGMAITYAAAGIAAGLSGTLVSTAFQDPWVLSAFALVFVVLAFSMFGFFELQLPTFLQSKLSEEANHLPGGKLYAVATMGALSALIVGPCVAAPLAGALLYIGQTGDALLGGAALFTLALGMGLPLLAVGVSAGTLLPRSGPWMEAVKKAFGVILLATGLWFVMPVLPAWLVMFAWAALLIVAAIYLRAVDPLAPTAHGWQRFWKGVGVALLLYGAALLIGALAGGRDPLQPLSAFAVRGGGAAGGVAGGTAPATHTPFQRVKNLAELEQRIAGAGKPVLFDFYADWCVSCKEMERFTFSDPAVRARLDGFLLLQADVTANNADDQALLKRFNLFGPPGIIFFGPQGQEIAGLRVIGFQSAAAFGKVLDTARERALARPAVGTPAPAAGGNPQKT